MRAAILLLLSLTAIVHLPAAAVLPSVISAAQLDNTCQCECCYQLSEYQTECLSPSDAFFEVPTCSHCTVSECSTRFPTPCSQPSSVVHAKCTTEHIAFFRLVPALFVLATIALLVYGFFFKKFDGYHREQDNNSATNQQSRRYNTFHNDSATSRPNETTKLLPRQSPNLTTLPTINEEEETPSNEHPTTSTPPQAPLSLHDEPTPAREPQTHQPSAPLLHDDTDLDTRISEVATVDSDSTYARDLPLLSEIPQSDLFDADAQITSLDVQHAAEANPSAIFERGVSDIAQQHSEAPRTESKEELKEADRTPEDEAIDQTESLSAADLKDKVMNTESVEQSNSNSDRGADGEPKEEDAQTAHVELQPIEQAVDIATNFEDPAVIQRTFEDKAPKEGQEEPVLLDAAHDVFDIAGSSVDEAPDVSTEPSPAAQLTTASLTVEGLDTTSPDDPKPVIADVPVDVDESTNVPSETAADSSTVARIITTDDSAIVQSEPEPAQDNPISDIPLITTPDESVEEIVKREVQTILNVSGDPTTLDTENDASVEDLQSEHIEPTDITPVSEAQIESSAEDKAERHTPDIPSEVMFKQENLQERRVHDESRTISLPKDEDSTEPSANMADIVKESIPDSEPLPEDDSSKIVETTNAAETSPEMALDVDFPRDAVGIQDEVEEVDPVPKCEEEDLEPLSKVIKSESDDSEQGGAPVEDAPKEQESHLVLRVEGEPSFAETSEPVPESQEATDSSAPVDSSGNATQTETLPPSDVRDDPLIGVSEATIEDNITAIEPDLQEASQVEVEEQVTMKEQVENEVSDHQNAPLASLETLSEADDFTVEVGQSQLTEDINNEQVTLGEQVVEAEEEVLVAEESEPVEPGSGLAEHGLETILTQTEETGTSDRATSNEVILQSSIDDEQPTTVSESVSRDSDAVHPPLQDFPTPEPTDSLAGDRDRDLNVSDDIATELEGSSSKEGRQQAHQPEDTANGVTGQANESESLRSAIPVPESTTEEPVDADDVDALGLEQSANQQELEQSAINESIHVDSLITDAVEAEKAASLEDNTEPDMANIGTAEQFSSETDDAEQTATEVHDFGEIETRAEAFETEVEEPEAAESSLREPGDVLPSSMEPEIVETEAVHTAAVETGSHEPVTTENEVKEAEAMDTATAMPMNMGATTVESASIEQAVERVVVAVAEPEGVVTTTDEDNESERHGTYADSTLETSTDSVNVEPILDEAKDSDEESDADLLGSPELSEPVGIGEPVVEPSIAFRDVKVVDMVAKGSVSGMFGIESHDIPLVEETLLGPDEAEQQEPEDVVETAQNEDATESVESKALEVEVVDSAVSQQGTTGSETVQAEMKAGPVNVETFSGTMNSIGSEQEFVQAIRVDGVEPTEISSADKPILKSEMADAEAMKSEVIDRVGVDDGPLSAEMAGTEIQETQVFDGETVVTEVVEEMVENELKDSEVGDATTEGQSTLQESDEEPSIDEPDIHEVAEAQMSEIVTEDNGEGEDVSTNASTDGHHPDGTNKRDLHSELQELSYDTPGAEMSATVTDPGAVGDECDEVETYAPEPVSPSGSETEVLERNESLDVEISGSAEDRTFSSESQPEAVQESLEPAGPSSVRLFENVGQDISVAPGVAVPLAELEAAEAGAASDVLDGQSEFLPPDLSPPESKLTEEHISMSASTESEGTMKEGNVKAALAIAEHYDNLSLEVPVDLPATSTKVDAGANVEVETAAAYSADDPTEATTPQILDVSEPALTENKKSEVVGHVQ